MARKKGDHLEVDMGKDGKWVAEVDKHHADGSLSVHWLTGPLAGREARITARTIDVARKEDPDEH